MTKKLVSGTVRVLNDLTSVKFVFGSFNRKRYDCNHAWFCGWIVLKRFYNVKGFMPFSFRSYIFLSCFFSRRNHVV